jgi:hypothetical protein
MAFSKFLDVRLGAMPQASHPQSTWEHTYRGERRMETASQIVRAELTSL